MKREDFEIAMKKLKKKYPGNIYFLGEKKELNKWSTGIDDLDEILEGGIPESRIIQIWGAESAAKTSLALHLCSQVSFAGYVDAEGMLDKKRVRTFGIRKKRMLISEPNSGEEVVEVVCEWQKLGIPLIVIDSVPACIPAKVQEDEIGKAPVALIPRLLSQQLFPRIVPNLNKSPSTILLINQVREKVGLMFGDPETYPGGRALKHFLALNIRMVRKGWYGPDKNKRVGMLLVAKIDKSKVCKMGQMCELNLSYDEGFVTHERMKQIVKEYKKGERV